MTIKSILLAVVDPQALVDITQALGPGWETTPVAGEADALAQLEQRAFDALLVDFNLGEPDSSELLNQALEKRPNTIRFLIAYEADLALVAARVVGSYQLLPKPLEAASLKVRIEQGMNDSESKPTGTDEANAVGEAPKVPLIYAEVLKALESPEVTPRQLGELIGKDAELRSEVLRLTNSDYLGLPRNLSDPVEAVEALGVDTVKALVMARQFLVEHSHLKAGYLSLEQLWEHCVNVGQIARDLMLFETRDRVLASQALTAGLLHDLGKIVLATNFDDLYGRVHSLARKQPVTLWDIEKEMFGANHGEIGGCLVGMWNMPAPIVEAVALHHEPPLGEQQQLTPLAAVHVANVLEHQLQPGDQNMMVPPIINTYFLNELGLLERLPVWRAALANRRSAKADPDAESAGSLVSSAAESQTGNYLPGPAGATRTSTSRGSRYEGEWSEVQPPRSRRLWVYGGVAAAILAVLALWLRTQDDFNTPELVYARIPRSGQESTVFSTPSSSDYSAAPAPQEAPVASVAEQLPAPPAPAVGVNGAEPSAPARESTAAAPPAAAPTPAPPSSVVTNIAPPVAAVPEKAPEFRLSGIIYTSVRPTAIVNGKSVTIGDQVNGALVIGIGPATVTLRINGQRRAYELQ